MTATPRFRPGDRVHVRKVDAPGHIRTLTSQMDYAPTLLGLLNWSYPSRFFGHDVRKVPGEDAHALLGNYQKLGHLEAGGFVVLRPQRGSAMYRYQLGTNALTPAPDDAGRRRARQRFNDRSFALTPSRRAALSTASTEAVAMLACRPAP